MSFWDFPSNEIGLLCALQGTGGGDVGLVEPEGAESFRIPNFVWTKSLRAYNFIIYKITWVLNRMELSAQLSTFPSLITIGNLALGINWHVSMVKMIITFAVVLSEPAFFLIQNKITSDNAVFQTSTQWQMASWLQFSVGTLRRSWQSSSQSWPGFEHTSLCLLGGSL